MHRNIVIQDSIHNRARPISDFSSDGVLSSTKSILWPLNIGNTR